MMPMALTTFRVFLLLTSLPEAGKQLSRLVKGTLDWWSGKKIAVIGPTASGKDSFLARLRNQEIPRVHANSTMGETVESFPVKLALTNRRAGYYLQGCDQRWRRARLPRRSVGMAFRM